MSSDLPQTSENHVFRVFVIRLRPALLLAFRISTEQDSLWHGGEWDNGATMLDHRAGGEMTALRRLHSIAAG